MKNQPHLYRRATHLLLGLLLGSYALSSNHAYAHTPWWLQAADDQRNIRDYGAVGNGIADDSRALQAALDAGGNADIYFPAGRYLIQQPVMKNISHLRLLGYGATLLGDPQLAGKAMIQLGDVNNPARASHLYIEGLQIELRGAGGAFEIQGAHNVFFEKCFFRDTQGVGPLVMVKLLNSFNVFFRGVNFNSANSTAPAALNQAVAPTQAIFIEGDDAQPGFWEPTNIGLRDSIIHGFSRQLSIQRAHSQPLAAGNTLEVTNSALNATPGAAISLQGNMEAMHLNGVHMEANQFGIQVLGTSRCTMSVRDSSFANIGTVFDLHRDSTTAVKNLTFLVRLEANSFIGNPQSPRFRLFGQNDAAVLFIDGRRMLAQTYQVEPLAGEGTLRNLVPTTLPVSSYRRLTVADDNFTLSNQGSRVSSLIDLPPISRVGAGFRLNFLHTDTPPMRLRASSDDLIRLHGGNQQITGADAAVSLSLISVQDENGNGSWMPTAAVGDWQ